MNPTASGIYRAEHCTPSCALPQVNTNSEESARGRGGHRFAELVPKLGPEKALLEVPERFREMCERIELEGLPLDPQVYRQEVAFAFDVATGKARQLGEGLDRQYPSLSPTEIAGTLDVVGHHGNGGRAVSIEDYKFDGYESHSPPPAENPQLLFGALCLSRLENPTAFELVLHHIRPDGSHWSESSEAVDVFDLDAFALRLRRLLDQVRVAEDTVFAGKTPNVCRGPWCRFCPAVTSCPPILAMVRAAAADPAAPAEQIRELLNAASQGDLAARKRAAALAFARLQEVQEALKPWKSALYLFAGETPIELPDGRVYGAVERPADELDARKARQVLAQLHSPDVAEAACTFETSKAAIERAVKPLWARQLEDYRQRKDHGEKLKKPTLTGLKEQVLAELKKVGGIRHTVKRQVRLHRVAAGGEVVIEGSGSEEEAAVPF